MLEKSPKITRRNLMITVGVSAGVGVPSGSASAQPVDSEKIDINEEGSPDNVIAMNLDGKPQYLNISEGSQFVFETPGVRNGNKVDVFLEVDRLDLGEQDFQRVGKAEYFETGAPITLEPFDFDNTNLLSVYQSETGDYSNTNAWSFEDMTVSDLSEKEKRLLICDFEMRVRAEADDREVAKQSVQFSLVFGLEGGLGRRLGYNLGGGAPIKDSFYVKPAPVVTENGGDFNQNVSERVKIDANNPAGYSEVSFN